MRRSRALVAVLGPVWLIGACSSSTSSSTSAPIDVSGAAPPPLLVHTVHGTTGVRPWTYCWTTPGRSQCADGGPRPPYVDATPGRVAIFEFHASAGWRFQTYLRRSDQPCARAYAVDATSRPDGTWTVPAAGPPGIWLVEVHGHGPEGDIAATFRWRTTVRGPGVRVAPSRACEG
jgi:hypothetical protein